MVEKETAEGTVASAAELRRFASDALHAAGCSRGEADTVADALVEADLRGTHSHGVLRLVVYLTSVRSGGIVPDAPMRWIEEHDASARLDAASGFGQTAMTMAVDRAIELAEKRGVGAVSVFHSTHYGIGARWAERVTSAGMVGIVLSNTGPVVAPFGSREPVLGTNPLTVGIPTSGAPIVLDMATSEAAYGRIVAAKVAGERIPDSWAVDPDGQRTSDPEAALNGALVPFGGHKGSGIATVIEALVGALTGARFSHEITDIWIDPSSQMGTGHIVLALRPMVPAAEAQARADQLASTIRGSSPAAGHERVLLPGQVEQERAASARNRGIQLPAGLAEQLDEIAGEADITPVRLEKK